MPHIIIEIPPTIVNFPTKDFDRANDVIEEVKIPCEANGTPPFTWVWKKFHIDNRHSVETDKITLSLLYSISANGLFTGKAFASFLDGYYQCFVSNSAGTVFSRKIKVKTTSKSLFKINLLPKPLLSLDLKCLLIKGNL